ncbi:hypothetical protein [Natronogracilivirga saccharolytica]|uniref:Uncharacterized protein n=1 Tax=Natronogracilivirga saccharolytica TaxID=2812953 RepID=A0A8J7RLZ6_9BACT|nr:hypothetical protein [Natronogracilivirga saccharolytica]MBP3193822.1 hypothetical protein [Natronogracilivirga saccharolytica]
MDAKFTSDEYVLNGTLIPDFLLFKTATGNRITPRRLLPDQPSPQGLLTVFNGLDDARED